MHQEPHHYVDDVRRGIWVLPDDLNLLALLCAIKEHLRSLSGRECREEVAAKQLLMVNPS